MLNKKNIQTSLDYTYSNLPSRVLLCGAILLLIILFSPTASYSRLPPIDPRDPYIRRNFSLNVAYTFTTSSTRLVGNTPRRTWRFGESYNFKTSGNIIDPRFIVYNYYTFYHVNHNSFGKTGSGFGLGFRSTIFRKFRFPITVYENRSYSEDTVRDSYGARMLLGFRRLPTTNLAARWNRTDRRGVINLNSNYQMKMRKIIGPTMNSFDYRYSIKDDGTTVSNYGLQNRTVLSRATNINAGLAYNTTSPTDPLGIRSKTAGFSMSLASKTSDGFIQRHGYSIYSNEVTTPDGTTRLSGENYGGSWSFKLTNNLSTGGGISYSENTTAGISSDSTNEQFFAHWALNYKLNRRLTLVSSSSYRKNESTVVAVATDESGSTYFHADAGISYARMIRKVSFSSNYKIGYVEHFSFPSNSGGTGLSQNLDLALRGMRYKKVYFTTTYYGKRVDNLSGDLWSTSQTLYIHATPRYWTKYGRMNSLYRFKSDNSWKNISSATSHYLNIYGNTKTVKRTRASAGYSLTMSKAANLSTYTSRVSVSRLNVSHYVTIKRGQLLLSLSTSYFKNVNGPYIDKRLTTRLTAKYARSLFRRIRWDANIGYVKDIDLDASVSNSHLGVSNTFTYYLRSWSFLATHQLTHTTSQFSPAYITEQFMLTVKRNFFRSF